MKNTQSIVGGHYADLLLNTLSLKPDNTAFADFHGLSASLRHRRYSGSKELTGGLLLTVKQESRDHTHGKRGHWVYAIRPSQRINARELLCRKLTLIVREWHLERRRQDAVAKMDKIVAPILSSKKTKTFCKWVEKQEAMVGESNYDTLSVEQAFAWREAVLGWKRNPRTALVAISKAKATA